MTPHLPAVSSKEVVRIALRLGFSLDRQSGSHAVYFRASDQRRVIVPVHAQKITKQKTLIGIIKDMGLSVGEFREMML